jgi:hypothetical protein
MLSIRHLSVAGTVLAGLMICGHCHSQEHTPRSASTLLPAGPLSVFGNQTVSSSGRPVRLACVGYNEPSDPPTDMKRMVSEGFNCARADWYDANLDLNAMDALVNAATGMSTTALVSGNRKMGCGMT